MNGKGEVFSISHSFDMSGPGGKKEKREKKTPKP
jgi:hypothetical protein